MLNNSKMNHIQIIIENLILLCWLLICTSYFTPILQLKILHAFKSSVVDMVLVFSLFRSCRLVRLLISKIEIYFVYKEVPRYHNLIGVFLISYHLEDSKSQTCLATTLSS